VVGGGSVVVVVGGSVVVVGGSVVVVVDGGAVVVVVGVGADVGVVGGLDVAVTTGWVVAVPPGWVVGVVVDGGSKAEAGSVETFDDLALEGVFGGGAFFGVLELVVAGLVTGFAVVVVVAAVVVVVVVVGGASACELRAASPCTLTGMSCWCTTSNSTATARRATVIHSRCNSLRWRGVTPRRYEGRR
jgi:hypothetical protein